MRRTPFKRKTYKEALEALNKPRKVRVAGHETAKELKKDIQALLREIVMLRDKKCILYGIKCNHEIGINDEGVVWQAEHLIERSNSATYADLKLVVLVCKNCHFWKHITDSNHAQYDKWVKAQFTPDRVVHWERCEDASWKASKVDWKLTKIVLEQELKKLKEKLKDTQ